jgi:hypothetical protein
MRAELIRASKLKNGAGRLRWTQTTGQFFWKLREKNKARGFDVLSNSEVISNRRRNAYGFGFR